MRLTGALLAAVASGARRGAARVFRPGPTAAFGRLDRLSPGFTRARELAAAGGYTPVLRHAGGHAVLYDRDSVIIEVVRAETSVVGGLERRYDALSAMIARALAGLGVELQTGELAGEYCPGRFSLHLVGGPKVAGIAQRAVRGASLTTAVLTVRASTRMRMLTAGVYTALGLAFDADTLGGVADHAPRLSTDQVADALAAELSAAGAGAPAAAGVPAAAGAPASSSTAV